MKNNEDDFLVIDEHNLDREWVDQSPKYFKWAARSAEARLRFDDAKAELEVVKAELGLKIRKQPERYGLDKITEVVVAAAVLMRGECADAVEKLHQARYDHGIAEAAVKALDQRCTALEKLVKLRLADYFSEPRAPEGAKEVMDEKVKQSVRRRGRGERKST